MVAPPDDASARDGRGRFAAGNPGGPGGHHRRSFELRRAAEDAVTPEMMIAMIRRAARMGLEGNLAAMRFVFERVVGRPADLPLEAQPLPLVLPELRTGGACAMATDSVLDGVCKGTIDRETAKVLLEGIQTRLKSIEVTDLQTRLGDLEKRADGVDFQARGSR